MRNFGPYIFGADGERHAADILRHLGFFCFRYDDHIAKAPGFHGEDVLGVKYIQAPDIGVADNFDVQVKTKASPTWSYVAGHCWRHGWPARQDRSYREFVQRTGRRLLMWVYETGPLRRVSDPQAAIDIRRLKYPGDQVQWLDRLGQPVEFNMEGELHCFYPRWKFENAETFLRRYKMERPPPPPINGRLFDD